MPARNEAAELKRLFSALEHLDVRPERAISICLLLDSCTDDSAMLVNAYAASSSHRILIAKTDASTTNAGRARHQAMTMGLAALAGADGILLTTDADSTPTSSWLEAMAAGLDHADIVIGKVIRTGRRPHQLQERIERYYDSLHALRRRLDPVPWEALVTHHQTTGANMGIWASAYRRLGGFSPVENGEDARLSDDASRAGLRVRRDAACVMLTSDRRDGRARGGMANMLRMLEAGDVGAVSVAHPQDVAWQYRMHALVRAAYQEIQLERVAVALGLTRDHVVGVARDCPNAEALAMRIVPEPPAGMRTVPLVVAEDEIARIACGRAAA
nr:glycosyltransferase [Sphingomonas oligophenolica]